MVLLTAAGVSSAAVILSNPSTGRYNNSLGTLLDTGSTVGPFPCANVGCGDASLSFPTAPDLSAASAALGNWLTNPAAPGGNWGPANQPIPLSWAVNSETAIIYTIDAGIGLTNVDLLLGVDNGIFVWLDGVYQFGARAGGGSFLGEYTRSLPDLTAGTHYLQILREDHGGSTGFGISLTADRSEVPSSASVPVPGSLPLLALGLGALALNARRRR